MNRLLNLIGMSLGGWLGWIVGSIFSIFTGFIVSVVGTGLELYLAVRVTKRLLP